MSCKTADFVEFRAGATEPKHCATELRAQHRTSEEEEKGEAQVGAEEISLAGRNRRPPQHFMRRKRHWAGAFATWDWRVHFLTSGPTGEMYLPPGCIPAKANVAGTFLWEGGIQLEEFSGQRLYTPSTRAVKLRRALVYFSQEVPGGR